MFQIRSMILQADSHDVSLVKNIIVNHLLREATVCVRDIVTTSHGACRPTSGTSRVLTEASLQRIKLVALIPAPADCEVWCVIKYLKA